MSDNAILCFFFRQTWLAMGTSFGNNNSNQMLVNNLSNNIKATILRCPNNSVKICKVLFFNNFIYTLCTLCLLCRSFQTFDVNQQSSGNAVYDPTAQQYAGGMYAPPVDNNYYGDGGEATEFESEPPLLEGFFIIVS